MHSNHSTNELEKTEVINFINTLLSKTSSESIQALNNIIFDSIFFTQYGTQPEITHLIIALEIFAYEQPLVSFEQSVFSDVKSIDQMVQKITMYKHLIFNIDFDVDANNAIYTINHNLQNKEISKIFLDYMIEKMSTQKISTSNKIYGEQ